MKRIKSFLTIMMATIFALSLVPAGALAADPQPVTGRLPDDKGTLTIDNAVDGETYTAWKIFDLASFSDMDNNLGEDQHSKDAYAYVISYTDSGTGGNHSYDNGWMTFLTTNGPSASAKYAVLSTATDEQKGSAYFVIDADPVTVGNTTTYHTVTATDNFKNAFSDVMAENKDETGEPEWTSNSLVQAFARAAAAYARTNNLGAAASGTGTGTDLPLTTDGKLPGADGAAANNDKLDLGYYVVDTSLGTLCSLDTLNKDAVVKDKNQVPTIDKKVQEDSLLGSTGIAGNSVTGYVDTDDADVGDYVYYKTLVKVEKGAQNYVLHDKMDSGLTWDRSYGTSGVDVYFLPDSATLESVSGWSKLAGESNVTIGTQADATTNYTNPTYSATSLGSFYTLLPSTGSGVDHNNDGDTADDVDHTFDIRFNDAFLEFLSDKMDGTTYDEFRLMVVYRAILNEGAVVNNPAANVNDTYLTYGDSSETQHDTTSTATWEFDVKKFTNTPAAKVLDGAQFQLSRGGTVLKLVKVNDGEYLYDLRLQSTSITGNKARSEDILQARVTNPDNSSGMVTVVDTITTKDGYLHVKGLDGDDYTLTETLAPAGYNQLTAPINFHITDVDESGTVNTDKTNGYGENNATPATSGQVVNTSASPHALATAATHGNESLYVQLDIENNTGTELPSTGGIGTTLFYVGGGILVLAAVILLVTKRRMNAND